MFYLLNGRLRFSELKRQIGCVTQRVLTKQLRELEADGLVNRFVYAEVPPRVEYELTKEGQSLKPILNSLKQWGEDNAMALIEKRDANISNEA